MSSWIENGQGEPAEVRYLRRRASGGNFTPGSLKRTLAYVSACFACLGSGTIYAWSAYSTSLSTKLRYDQRSTSIVASCGACGLFLLGVLFGPLIDDPRIGPRKMCFVGGCLLFTGYFLLAMAYNGQVIGEQPVTFAALCLLMVGAGSSACCMSSMAVVAQSFSEKLRGMAMSVPLGLLGLSAFIFSAVRSVFTEIWGSEVESTYKFLLFLAIMTGGGNCLASFGLRVAKPVGNLIGNDEEVHIRRRVRFFTDERAAGPRAGHERTPLVNDAGPFITRGVARNAVNAEERERSYVENFKIVLKEQDSRLFFAALFLLAGVGLSYITSLGKVVQLLLESELGGPPASGTPQAKAALQQLQSGHVALFSLASFTGRIVFGSLSDVTLRKGHGRGTVLVAAGWAMLIAVGSAATKLGGSLSRLWLITGIIGLAYGAVFGVAPTLAGEEIIGGVRHFGRNWGVMSWAPPVGNQLLSLIFGIVVDSTQGRCNGYRCFAWSFAVNAAACAGAIALLMAFQKGYHARCVRRQLDSD